MAEFIYDEGLIDDGEIQYDAIDKFVDSRCNLEED